MPIQPSSFPGQGPGSPSGPTFYPRNFSRFRITGITKDSTDAPFANCTVEVYEVVPGVEMPMSEPHGQLRGMVVSDASGSYTIDVTSLETGLQFRCIAKDPTGLLVGATLALDSIGPTEIIAE
jgi:hypothetical protein